MKIMEDREERKKLVNAVRVSFKNLFNNGTKRYFFINRFKFKVENLATNKQSDSLLFLFINVG